MYNVLSDEFWLNTFQESKVKVTKDHGKKFRTDLAVCIDGIAH